MSKESRKATKERRRLANLLFEKSNRLGQVISFDTSRGFGFIRDNQTGREVFFHITDVEENFAKLIQVGSRVTFSANPDAVKGPKAVQVQPFRGKVYVVAKKVPRRKRELLKPSEPRRSGSGICAHISRRGSRPGEEKLTSAQRKNCLRTHQKLDRAVLDASGLLHDIGDEEILERLLALNLEREQ